MVRLTCPSCASEYPLEAGFIEPEGKRFAAFFAELEPPLGRALLMYLRLFKPGKTALRLSRAFKLSEDLVQLVRAGDVARDERTGVRRPATVAQWVQGIEQLVEQQATLTLPLSNHNYLRAVVFGLADKADAQGERSREESARQAAAARGGSAPVTAAAALGAAPTPQQAVFNRRLDLNTQYRLGLIELDEAVRQLVDTGMPETVAAEFVAEATEFRNRRRDRA